MSIKTFHSWLVARGVSQPSGAPKGRRVFAAPTAFQSLLQKKLRQRSIADSSRQPVARKFHTPAATTAPSLPPLQSPSTSTPNGDRPANAPSVPPASASTDTSPSLPANTNQLGNQTHTRVSDTSHRLAPRIQPNGTAPLLSVSPQDSVTTVPKHRSPQDIQDHPSTATPFPSAPSPRNPHQTADRSSNSLPPSSYSLLDSPPSSTSSVIPAHSPKLETAPTTISAAPDVAPSFPVPTDLLYPPIDGSELQKRFASPDHTLTLSQKSLDQTLLIALTRTVPIGVRATVAASAMPVQYAAPGSSPHRWSFSLPLASPTFPSTQRWRPLRDLLHLLQRYQATNIEVLFVNPVSQRTILVQAPSVSQIAQILQSLPPTDAPTSFSPTLSSASPSFRLYRSLQPNFAGSPHTSIFPQSPAVLQHPAAYLSAMSSFHTAPLHRLAFSSRPLTALHFPRWHQPTASGTPRERTLPTKRLIQQQQPAFFSTVPARQRPIIQAAYRENLSRRHSLQRFKSIFFQRSSNRIPRFHFRAPLSPEPRRANYIQTSEESRQRSSSQFSILQPQPSPFPAASRKSSIAKRLARQRSTSGLPTVRTPATPSLNHNHHLFSIRKASYNHARTELYFRHKTPEALRSSPRPVLQQRHQPYLGPASPPSIQAKQLPAISATSAIPTLHQKTRQQRHLPLPSVSNALSRHPRFSYRSTAPRHRVPKLQPSIARNTEPPRAHQRQEQQNTSSTQPLTGSFHPPGAARQQAPAEQFPLRHLLITSQLPSPGSPARHYGTKDLPAIFRHSSSTVPAIQHRAQRQDSRTRAAHRLQTPKRLDFAAETGQKLRSSHLLPLSRLQTLGTRRLSSRATAPEPASRSQAGQSPFLTTTTRNNRPDHRNQVLAGRKEAAIPVKRHQFLPASPKTPVKNAASPSPTFGQPDNPSLDPAPNVSTPAATIVPSTRRSYPLYTHQRGHHHPAILSRQPLYQQQRVRLSPEPLPTAIEEQPNASNGKAQRTHFSSIKTPPARHLQRSPAQRHIEPPLHTPRPSGANVQRQFRVSISSQNQARFYRHNGKNLLDTHPTFLRETPLIVRHTQGNIQHSKAPFSGTPASRIWTQSPVSISSGHLPLASLQSSASGPSVVARSFIPVSKRYSAPIQFTQQADKARSRHYKRPGAPGITDGSKHPITLSGVRTTASEPPLHPAPIRRRQPPFSHLLPSFKKQPYAPSPDTLESSSTRRIPIRPVSSSLKKLLSHATSERIQPPSTQILNPATRSHPTISLKNVTQSHTPPPSVSSPQSETDGAQQSPVDNRIPPRWNRPKIRSQTGQKPSQSLLQTDQAFWTQNRSHSTQYAPLPQNIPSHFIRSIIATQRSNTATHHPHLQRNAAQPALARTTAQLHLLSSEQHATSHPLSTHSPSLETTKQQKNQQSSASDFQKFSRIQGKKVKKPLVMLYRTTSHHLRFPSAATIAAISRLSSHPRPVLNHRPAALPSQLLQQRSVPRTPKPPRLLNGSLELSATPLRYAQSRQPQSPLADYSRTRHISRNGAEKASIRQVPLSQASPESSSLLQRSSHTLHHSLTAAFPRLHQPEQTLSTKITRSLVSPSLRPHHQVLLRSTPTSSVSSAGVQQNSHAPLAPVASLLGKQHDVSTATLDATSRQPALSEKAAIIPTLRTSTAPFSRGATLQTRLRSTPGSERGLPTFPTYAPDNGQHLHSNRVTTDKITTPSISDSKQRLRPNRDAHTGKALQHSRQPLTSSVAQAPKQAKGAVPSSIPKTVLYQNKAGNIQKSSYRRSASMATLRKTAIGIRKQTTFRVARQVGTMQQSLITDRSFRQTTGTQLGALHLPTSAAQNRAENEMRPLPSTSPLEPLSPSPGLSSPTGSTPSASPSPSIHQLTIQSPAATISYRPPTVTTASSAQTAMHIAPSTPVLSVSSPSITITDPSTTMSKKPAEGTQQEKLHSSPSSPADTPVTSTVMTSPPSPSIRTPNSPYPKHFPATAPRSAQRSHRESNANSQGNHQQASHSFQRQHNAAGVIPPSITSSFAEASETALQDPPLQLTEDLSPIDGASRTRTVAHTGESLPGTSMPASAPSFLVRMPMAQLPSILAAFIAGAKQRNIPTSRVRFTLQPENLGSVDIAITITGNRVTLRMFVEKSSVKETFEKRLPLLREALATHRLSLQDVTVQVATDDHRTILEHSLQQQMGHSGNQQYESQREYLEMLSTLYELSQQVDQEV